MLSRALQVSFLALASLDARRIQLLGTPTTPVCVELTACVCECFIGVQVLLTAQIGEAHEAVHFLGKDHVVLCGVVGVKLLAFVFATIAANLRPKSLGCIFSDLFERAIWCLFPFR